MKIQKFTAKQTEELQALIVERFELVKRITELFEDTVQHSYLQYLTKDTPKWYYLYLNKPVPQRTYKYQILGKYCSVQEVTNASVLKHIGPIKSYSSLLIECERRFSNIYDRELLDLVLYVGKYVLRPRDQFPEMLERFASKPFELSEDDVRTVLCYEEEVQHMKETLERIEPNLTLSLFRTAAKAPE